MTTRSHCIHDVDLCQEDLDMTGPTQKPAGRGREYWGLNWQRLELPARGRPGLIIFRSSKLQNQPEYRDCAQGQAEQEGDQPSCSGRK